MPAISSSVTIFTEAARSDVHRHGRGGCPGVPDGDEVGRGPGEQGFAAGEHLGRTPKTGPAQAVGYDWTTTSL